jgi:hypothetical protein
MGQRENAPPRRAGAPAVAVRERLPLVPRPKSACGSVKAGSAQFRYHNLGNLRKAQSFQWVDGVAHLARANCKLRDRRKVPAKTTDRPRRTLGPFILPSIDQYLRLIPCLPSFFPETVCAAPAYEIPQDRVHASD